MDASKKELSSELRRGGRVSGLLSELGCFPVPLIGRAAGREGALLELPKLL